jgi:hypothetical protein
MTERSPAHPQRDAVLQASQQARANGRLIRMTVTTAGGLHRLVVTPDGRVVPLDQPSDGRNPPRRRQHGQAAAKRISVLDRFPMPVRPMGRARPGRPDGRGARRDRRARQNPGRRGNRGP